MTQLIKSYPEHDYLDQEIEMLLNSGLTVTYKSAKDDSLIGVGLIAYWKVNPNYKTFRVSGMKWLNTAAKVARDFGKTDTEIIVIYRDLTYQWIYHVAQCEMQRLGKSGSIYCASGFLNPELRFSHITIETVALTSNMMHKASLENDAVCLYLGTYKGFMQSMNLIMAYNYAVLDIVEYGNLDYRLSNGVNLMQGQTGSMIFLEASPYTTHAKM